MNFLNGLMKKMPNSYNIFGLTGRLKNFSELDHINLLKNTLRMGEYCLIFLLTSWKLIFSEFIHYWFTFFGVLFPFNDLVLQTENYWTEITNRMSIFFTSRIQNGITIYVIFGSLRKNHVSFPTQFYSDSYYNECKI